MPVIWVFAALLAFFHSSEFALAFGFQRQDLSLSCAQLDHMRMRRHWPKLRT